MFSSLIKAARVSSNMTQEELSAVIGLSVPTYLLREKDPTLFTVGELSKVYETLNIHGKKIIKDYLESLFLLPKE